MRLPILFASFAVGFSFVYRYYFLNKPPTSKTTLSWGFILIILAILAQTPLSNVSDMLSYIIILIIVLNDGYEFLNNNL